MSYAEFLDVVARSPQVSHSTALLSGAPSALLMSTALDAPPPPPLPRISFRAADVLQTSAGGVVWTAAEARRARRARDPLTLPPWRTAVPHGMPGDQAAAGAQRPAVAYSGAEEEARQHRERQLVSAALRLRVASVASTMLRDGDSVGNAWDEQLTSLQGALSPPVVSVYMCPCVPSSASVAPCLAVKTGGYISRC